ncbi:insulin-induced protein [Ophiostoma piceae UAMH 11346]|uniref:Insulin-induced protein n=1 Tax=Ophiostoma piceae (strain UAMH 11346) TaxID=1262450 RepID=S3CIG7_OPHP1|nr:insulin-induced protein [Ophiostoma piceae UAMH 11346]
MSANTPVIHRPIPRRPFARNPATPPNETSQKSETQQATKDASGTAKFLNSRPSFIDTDISPTPGGDDSISRAPSIMNLTSSTLFGIFSPSISSRPSGVFESGTPWGTGTETPARDLLEGRTDDQGEAMVEGTTASAAEIDEVRKASQSLMMLQRQRRRGESFGADGIASIKLNAAPSDQAGKGGVVPRAPPGLPRITLFFSLLVRAALLFTLGMGYGVLMARLRSETHANFEDFAMHTPPSSTAAPTTRAEYDASYDWRYLVSWGLSGVVLGTLLPWFDGVWDRAFAGSDNILGLKARTAPEVDWALVVRGIGAFAGVVFAMRKLPWASTMQASVTLALVNPFLWYLLDRSRSGLLLAAAVGFIGSTVLMTLDLDLMPNPGVRTASDQVGYSMGSSRHQNGSSRAPAGATSTDGPDPASGVTAETAVWMLSVLFCSCICFGNIGRRLALSPASTSRQQ